MTVLTALTLLLLLIGCFFFFYKVTRKEFISHVSLIADDRFKPLVGKQEGKTMVKGILWLKSNSFSAVLKEFKFIVTRSSLSQW